MPSLAIILGLCAVVFAIFVIDAPALSQVTTIQEQTAFLSRMATAYFGNTLLWLGILASRRW